jgi:Tol biopolymer transport system component
MRFLAAIIMTAALLFASTSVQKDDRAEVALRAAIDKETVDGDLKGAIEEYVKLAQSSNREVAAKALLRAGQCYEKLGNSQARTAYERLVRDFGDQGEVVREAQARLATLRASAAAPKFTKIRVPTKLPLEWGKMALSPDGQQLAYFSDGAVWLLPVHGASDPEIAGQPRRITEPVPAWYQANDIAWSRNGKWLVLFVLERPSQGPETSSIYLVPSAGGEPRKAAVPNQWDRFGDWVVGISPDGNRLAFTSRKENEDKSRNSVYIASTSGGTAHMVTPPISNQPEFSPDGKKIAYVGLLPNPDRDPEVPVGRQVWVADVAGGTPTLVFELPAQSRLHSPIWSPDGKMLAFLVASTVDWGVAPGIGCGLMFIVPISPDGRPAGAPTKIELPRKTGRRLAGWSNDNKIGLALPNPEVAVIYTVPASGGTAVQLTPKAASMPSWTPDGKRIYFAGRHHGTITNIEYVPASGGQIVRIPIRGPHPIQAVPPWGGPSVSPDGSKIVFDGLFYDAPVKIASHIFILPIAGGEVTERVTGLDDLGNACWSPDGKQIAFVGVDWRDEGSIYNIYVMPAEGGEPRRLTSDSDNVDEGYIAWSPDGKYLAFKSRDHKIRLFPLGGGPSQVLVEGVRCYWWGTGLAWSPDGAELAYTTNDRIWKVNLQSRKSEELKTGLDAIHMQMAWSPDGKTIAFCAGQGGDPELWLMSDFLPLLQRK